MFLKMHNKKINKWLLCKKLAKQKAILLRVTAGFWHVEAIRFLLNTVGSTLSTIAKPLKLFCGFQNRPQFI
jgi:hypothetical protein